MLCCNWGPDKTTAPCKLRCSKATVNRHMKAPVSCQSVKPRRAQVLFCHRRGPPAEVVRFSLQVRSAARAPLTRWCSPYWRGAGTAKPAIGFNDHRWHLGGVTPVRGALRTQPMGVSGAKERQVGGAWRANGGAASADLIFGESKISRTVEERSQGYGLQPASPHYCAQGVAWRHSAPVTQGPFPRIATFAQSAAAAIAQ